jgi:hypothetical protein
MRPMLSSTAVEEDAAIPCAIEMVDDEEEANLPDKAHFFASI